MYYFRFAEMLNKIFEPILQLEGVNRKKERKN